MQKIRKLVVPSAGKSNGPAVFRVVKEQGPTTTALVPDLSVVANDARTGDWIKDAIANELNRRCPDADVKVVVEKVDYGLWIWDEEAQIHNHMTARELVKDLGKQEAKDFINSLETVNLNWDVVRSWRDIEL
jgi:hypothetical protein